ncbi:MULTISPECIES: hypothetical protein [Deinococcus]|uniref:Uncharacterized protein n=1 Tax=Deinococcus cavernae TaxID=2320857 RepID=A0A418V7E6_9DEIO|nr:MULTISPECIES: hypothetical protein [Deinococcus]RJF71989.1 hypothetical protein D3875_10890 [Deinococcus cavernae]
MSNSTLQRSPGRAGSTFPVYLLILALLLGVVTAYAVRDNPLYSDRNAYGISKYAFIDQCKENLHETGQLQTTVVFQGQPVSQGNLNKLIQDVKLLKAGETLHVNVPASSREIVSQVQPIAEQQGQPQRTGLQWQSPVELQASGGTMHRTLSPAVMQCQYDKAKGKTETQLFISQ